MENVHGNVFMSCVVGGMYQEFTLEEGTIEELSIYLKNMQKKNNKDGIFLKQIKLFRSLIKGEYLSLEEFYNEEREKENDYLKEILVKLPIKRFFQIQMSQVPEWFYYLGKYAKNGSKKDYLKQEKLFHEGLKNTEYLNKMGIKVVDNQFVCTEDDKTQVIEKPTIYVKTSKKIS